MDTEERVAIRDRVLGILREIEESGEVSEATLFLNKILRCYMRYLREKKEENIFRIYIYSIVYKEANKKPKGKTVGGFSTRVLERGIREVKGWDVEDEESS